MNNQNMGPQHCTKTVCWQAIIAGSLTALGLIFLFNLLSVGLGLSLFSRTETGVQAMTVIGFAWLLIGIYILLFLSGWVTGRLMRSSYSSTTCHAVLHGFLMWTVYVVISLVILSHMTESTIYLLRASLATVGPDVAAASSSVDPSGNPTAVINKQGFAALATFFVFFGGAFGACVGAIYGLRECRKANDVQ